jgi:hypothetical protein
MVGGSITAGDITVTSNVTVGNYLYIGTATDTAKYIVFTGGGAGISAFEDTTPGFMTGLNLSCSTLELTGTNMLYATNSMIMSGEFDFREATGGATAKLSDVTGDLSTSASHTLHFSYGVLTGID